MRTFSLQDYPQKLEPDDLAATLKKVRLKDEIAIEIMILHHVRLVISTVNKYIVTYNCGYLGDDLECAALAGLVTAVNNVANGKMIEHDNIGGYITHRIRYALSDCFLHNCTVYFPKESERKKILPLDSVSVQKRYDSRFADVIVDNTQMFNLIEELKIITTNAQEKNILKLRGEGYNDSEIGTRLGLSRLVVQRIRSKLKTRFQRREKND